jgi:hypothetical protein
MHIAVRESCEEQGMQAHLFWDSLDWHHLTVASVVLLLAPSHTILNWCEIHSLPPQDP